MSIIMVLPRFRCSFIFCLLLLLSISSATDSFQQHIPRSHVLRQQRQPRTLSPIAIATVSVSGGATVYSSTEPYISTSLTINDRRRSSLWNIFVPGRTIEADKTKSQQHRRPWQRRRRKVVPLDDEEYQRRKEEWADRYATLDGLRETFGSNRNKFFGDLDATTTRKLYKSLLPTAVCELVLDVDVRPEELAPLAFEARKAAKLYARERCHVPARWLAKWYDGYRQWKTYGRFQIEGMSYDQVWDKYYQRSTSERRSRQRIRARERRDGDDNYNDDNWTEEEIVAQTCMKILESSCRTNPLVDQMTLGKRAEKKNKRGRYRMKNKIMNDEKEYNDNDDDDECNLMDDERERENLEKIAKTLEIDVRKLLDPYNNYSQ